MQIPVELGKISATYSTEKRQLLFILVFSKADVTPYKPSDTEKKTMLLFKGGEDMKTLPQAKLLQVFAVKLTEMRECKDEKRLQWKKYLDMHKWAKPNNIAVGDKLIIWQNKTTLKPLFDPSSYTVTEVNGNRVCPQRHGGSTRVTNLIPSWGKINPQFAQTTQSWRLKGTSGYKTTIDADTAHVAELPEIVATDQHHANSESQSEPALFEVNQEAAVHRDVLLQAAE